MRIIFHNANKEPTKKLSSLISVVELRAEVFSPMELRFCS